MRDIADGKQMHTIRACRNAGKTTLLAMVAIQWVLSRQPAKVVFTSTRKDQLNDNNWQELRRWIARLQPSIRNSLRVSTEQITVIGMPANMIVARAGAADNATASAGQHSDHFLWIFDEAPGIEDIIYDVMIGSLTTHNSAVILSGNPTISSGWFYRTHKNPDVAKDWNRIHVSAFDVKNEPYFDPKWIDLARNMWGEDSWQWESYVLGEFPTAQKDCVIPLWAVHDAVNREVGKLPDRFPIWGFDPALGGDNCALAKRQGNVLLEPVKVWRESDHLETIPIVADEFDKAKREGNPPATICVDATGLGNPIVNDMRKIAKLPVTGIQFSERAVQHEIYLNRRVEMIHEAAEWFKGKDVSIQRDEKLIEELVTFRSIRPDDNSSRRVIALEPSKKIKERLGRSPDRAYAFALTFCAKTREVDRGYLDRAFPAPAGRFGRKEKRSGRVSWMVR